MTSADGIRLFLTRVRPRAARGTVVLAHGAGSPASAVWDLPHGHSVMEALARRGFDCFTVDVRGFGGSTSPEALRRPGAGAPPAVRAAEVMPDLQAAVDFAREASGRDRVDLVGWSWGVVVSGMYAGRAPERIRRLVLFAPVFDRRWPSRHVTADAWREEPRALYEKWLDPEREDPRVRRAYVERLFRFAKGDVLRLPNGPYRDIYGPDAPVWAPERVTADTLIIRGTEDRASLRAAALRLFDRLLAAKRRMYVEIAGADHFAFRTRKSPELQSIIVAFLDAD